MGSDLVFLFCLKWNADKNRVDKVRYWTAARLFRQNRFVQVGVYGGGWIYGGWIWS
jgi:hypothetical protein